jgi:hypothetical protein
MEICPLVRSITYEYKQMRSNSWYHFKRFIGIATGTFVRVFWEDVDDQR